MPGNHSAQRLTLFVTVSYLAEIRQRVVAQLERRLAGFALRDVLLHRHEVRHPPRLVRDRRHRDLYAFTGAASAVAKAHGADRLRVSSHAILRATTWRVQDRVPDAYHLLRKNYGRIFEHQM